MSTVRDFYTHMAETLKIPVQLLDFNGAPIDVEDHLVGFATSLELATEALELLSSANSSQISVTNVNTAIVEVTLFPTANAGYVDDGTHQYQLRATHNDTDEVTVFLEGKLFIRPSLFD